MAFPERDVAQLLADCKRHCCVCFRWCGARIHLHHIHARADGGPDTIDNAIPVCLDCHAEVESRSNMGRQFSQAELHEHKRRWLEICRDRPDVLIRAGRSSSEAGPLEAVLSELEFNKVLLQGDHYRHDYSIPVESQFDRALAANAVMVLPENVRDVLFQTYRLIHHVAELLRSRGNQAPAGNAYNELSNQIRDSRTELRTRVDNAARALRQALGAEV